MIETAFLWMVVGVALAAAVYGAWWVLVLIAGGME